MMKILKILIFIFLLATTFKTYAYNDEEKYKECILKNTSERDKVILVKWIFGNLADHPSLNYNFKISKEEKISNDKSVANYLMYILGDKCFKEAKKVLTNKDGEITFLIAFELLGELAFSELTSDKKVSDSFKSYLQYIDPLFFEKYGGLVE